MRVGADRRLHLSYCTNIHPGNGWDEVFANLRRYAPALRARIAPGERFALGLRLSGRESEELLQGERLAELRAFLDEHGLYVPLLNGFPYGPFHKQPIKAEVFAPDWRDEERVRYTLRLAEILARLLPDGVDGGISTSPLSYKLWGDQPDQDAWEQVTANVARVAEALARLWEQRGALLHLDIEPEPDGLVETSAELAAFFERWLLDAGARRLADALGVSREAARDTLRQHVRVCWDTCHMSVAYEQPADVLQRYADLGIQVGRIQVSAALRIPLPDSPAARQAPLRALEPFAESVYLHQVRQREGDGALRRFPDLAEALAAPDDPRVQEWRTHFHVPIFVERYGAFHSTQDDIRRVLALAPQRFTSHLEIETYTWDVLPAGLKRDLSDSISREYAWVLGVLA